MYHKGQSAIEYLTTYGWMLLVVVISGAAIYATIDSGCEISVRGDSLGSDLSISESGVTGDDVFSVVFRNTASGNVEVKSVEINGREESSIVDIPVGDEKSYSVIDVKSSGSCQEYDMSVVYDSGTLENLEQSFTVTGSFEIAQIIVTKLLAATDEIGMIETRKSVMPTGNETMCFGGQCGDSDGGSLPGDAKYVNISGDSMQGSLSTNDFNAACYGDLCNSTKTNDPGYVSTENNTMTGTLNITEIKPINNLCLGGTCS